MTDVGSLQNLCYRASCLLSWVQRAFDDGFAEEYGLSAEDRNLANSWYHCIAMLVSELIHAGYQEDPEAHRKAVLAMAETKLKRLDAFEALERKYTRS